MSDFGLEGFCAALRKAADDAENDGYAFLYLGDGDDLEARMGKGYVFMNANHAEAVIGLGDGIELKQSIYSKG